MVVEAKLLVDKEVLMTTCAECIEEPADAENASFDDAFEREIGWLESSGITLKDYIVTDTEESVVINTIFDVDKDILRDMADADMPLMEVFENEFNWVAQSGIQLVEATEED